MRYTIGTRSSRTFPDLTDASELVAIIGLGLGSFSVDAHVFGRREIIIPRADSAPARLLHFRAIML